MSRLLDSAGAEIQQTAARLGTGSPKPIRARRRRRLARRRSFVPVHGDQFCRQSGDRDRRGPDDARTEAHSAPVRADRLELLLVVFTVRDRHRFCRQPRTDALGVAGYGAALGVDPVPDARKCRVRNCRCLPDRRSAPAKDRPLRWRCIRPTNGSPTSSAHCRPRSSCRAAASASWWRCRCSTGSSSAIPGTGPLVCLASPVWPGRGPGWRSGARARSPLAATRAGTRMSDGSPMVSCC